jgi:tetratricopeptide (TPR) repeat protein
MTARRVIRRAARDKRNDAISIARPARLCEIQRMRRTLLLLLAALHPALCADSADPILKFPPEGQAKFREAAIAYNNRDYDKAMAGVEEAEKIHPGTALLANFRGAIHLDRKEYDKAAECFDQAMKIDPSFWPARYNRIEIPFRLGNYSEARAKYETLLAREPKSELFQYRIFLTHILEKNKQAAEETMNRLPFPGDTPAYYFAHAVWELAVGNKEEAGKFLRGAAFAFSPEKRRPFLEPLEVLGWIGKKAPAGGQPEAKGASVGPEGEQDGGAAPKSRMFLRDQ